MSQIIPSLTIVMLRSKTTHAREALSLERNSSRRIDCRPHFAEMQPLPAVTPILAASGYSTPDIDDAEASVVLSLHDSQLPRSLETGFMFGSGETEEKVDICLALRPGESGISRQHFSIKVEAENERPILVNHSRLGTRVTSPSLGPKRYTAGEQGRLSNGDTITAGLIKLVVYIPHRASQQTAYMNNLRRLQSLSIGGRGLRNVKQTQDANPVTRINPAELTLELGRIGNGACGNIYKAFDASNKIYAVKTFNEGTGMTRQEAHRHMQIFSDYRHVSIIQMHPDKTVQCHRPYIVMDYMPLGSLDKYPQLSDGKAAHSVFQQLFQGAEYLHNHGFTHRDLKPANVLVRSLEPISVVVADFDFAMWDIPLAKLCGTPLYVAPEILTMANRKPDDGRFYTNKVDIWSLGIMVLECCTFQNLASKYPTKRSADTARLWFDTVEEHLRTFAKQGCEYMLELAKLMLVRNPRARPEATFCLSFLDGMAADFNAIKQEMRTWIRYNSAYRPPATTRTGHEAPAKNPPELGVYHLQEDDSTILCTTVGRAVSIITDHYPALNDAFQEMIAEDLHDAQISGEDFEEVTDVADTNGSSSSLERSQQHSSAAASTVQT